MPKKLAISIIVLVALLLPLIVPVGAAFATTHTTPLETTPLETTPLETTPLETTPLETTPLETTPLETTPLVTTPTNNKNDLTQSPTCSINPNPTSFKKFLGDMLGDGGSLLGANIVTSLLTKIPWVGGFFEPADQAVDFVFNWWMIAILVGAVASLGVWLAGALVNFGLVINTNLITDNVVINAGYGTILGLVNIGFVVAIIIIAFATMFRRSGWDIQSALVKLIIAALLINFSLFFAGIILNVGTQLTKVLLSNACSDSLVSQFNIVTLNSNVDAFLRASGSNFFQERLLSILSIFFASILTIIGALTLFGIFLFLVARYVVVTILIVFMPIIWLGFIFPKLQVPGLGNTWSGWWKQFLKWVFFGPLMAFFLYLTTTLVNSLGTPESQLLAQEGGPINAIGQMLVVTLLSLGGLYTANKLSITGASAMYGVATKAGKMGLARLKTTGIGMASAPLRTKTAGKIMGRMAGGKMVIPGTKFTIPGTKNVGRLGIQAEAYSRKQAEAEANKYKGLTPEQQNQVLSGLPPNSAHAKIMEGLIKSDKLENPEQYLTAKTKASFKRDGHEDIYKSLEQYAIATIESIEALAKGDIDEAARIVQKEIFALAKPGDIGKKIKLSRIFSRPSLDKFKNKDGTYDRQAHAKAVYENNIIARVVTRALLSDSPEKIVAAFKSLSPGEERVAFNTARDNMLSELKLVGKTSVIPKKVNEYLVSNAGQKLFKNLYLEPEKETMSREEFERIIKDSK